MKVNELNSNEGGNFLFSFFFQKLNNKIIQNSKIIKSKNNSNPKKDLTAVNKPSQSKKK